MKGNTMLNRRDSGARPPAPANKGEFCWRYFLRCFTVLPFRLLALEVLQTV
jgi:hypothetical protein